MDKILKASYGARDQREQNAKVPVRVQAYALHAPCMRSHVLWLISKVPIACSCAQPPDRAAAARIEAEVKARRRSLGPREVRQHVPCE